MGTQYDIEKVEYLNKINEALDHRLGDYKKLRDEMTLSVNDGQDQDRLLEDAKRDKHALTKYLNERKAELSSEPFDFKSIFDLKKGISNKKQKLVDAIDVVMHEINKKEFNWFNRDASKEINKKEGLETQEELLSDILGKIEILEPIYSKPSTGGKRRLKRKRTKKRKSSKKRKQSKKSRK